MLCACRSCLARVLCGFVHVQHVRCMFDPQNFQRSCGTCSVRDVRDVDEFGSVVDFVGVRAL